MTQAKKRARLMEMLKAAGVESLRGKLSMHSIHRDAEDAKSWDGIGMGLRELIRAAKPGDYVVLRVGTRQGVGDNDGVCWGEGAEGVL